MASWEGEHGTFGITTGAFDMFKIGRRGLPTYDEVMAYDGDIDVGNGRLTLGIGDFHPYPEMNPSACAEITVEDDLQIASVYVPLVDVDTGYERDEDTAMREAYAELSDAVLWRQY